MNSFFPIKPNACLGLFAPAGPISEEKITPAIDLLSEMGFRVKTSPNLFGKSGYLSGTIQERLSDINFLLDDSEVAVLFAARGGVGSSQLLPDINYSKWKDSSKLLIGFSDVSALQWSLWGATRLPFISGMTLTSQFRRENPHLNLFTEILLGKKTSLAAHDLSADSLRVLRNGEANGILIGGTLSILNTLLGTPFFPDFESIVLFIEDINEPLYKIERNLVQLKLAGVLDKVAGLILGRFKDQENDLEIWSTVEQLFPPPVPVISGFPYGHFPQSCALPGGIPAYLQTDPFEIHW